MAIVQEVNLEALTDATEADTPLVATLDQGKQDADTIDAGPDRSDPDVAALLAAQEEALAEASGQPEVKDVSKTDPIVAQPTNDQIDNGASQADIMVPKARLDQEIRKNDEIARRLIEAENRLSATPQQTQAQQRPATPQIGIADLDAAIKQVGEAFDAGELSASQFTERLTKLQDQRTVLITNSTVAKALNEHASKDIRLNEVTETLIADHPYVTKLSPTHGKFLEQEALNSLAAAGNDMRGRARTPREVIILRTEVAKLSDKFGPLLTGLSPEQVGLKAPPAPTANNNQQSADELARARQAKLDLARQVPPDISNMTGRVDDGVSVPTLAELNSMSEEDIGALPESTRKKIRGNSF